ncbi:chaperonin-like RbcX protein 2, chloroplastic [Cucurbita pepo subsp. pepo]|uniref:chaperonin-like RbcX protein 2, chloroplastic n=1 Tax=Cucurbita pepo subsp. pepo TaxID=3664 RepID=UPI000C9D2D57|nr:chaperonin-like RbcX protein 2, chloroplastic [Cucurbita pepo subsp. pepo]
MVGALSIVGSSAVDSHTSPCLCLDALPTTSCSMGRKRLPKPKHLYLSSSFVDSGREWLLSADRINRSSRKQHKNRRLIVVDELGGQYEDTFDDVKLQILNYFTYKAVRTVMNQLYEMNPPQYRWLYDFLLSNKPSDGKHFMRTLVKEKQDLAERVMITRLHLYGKWVKKCNHAEIYQEISDENVELMRERLMQTVIWPSDDTNTEKIG